MMERKLQCQICRKSLSTQKSLRNHIYIHTGEKYEKCLFCPKSFRDPSTLRRHLKTHSRNKKQYKCTLSSSCKKAFTTPYILTNHIQSHHRGKRNPIPKFKCKICERRISDKSNFQRHLKTHTKEKAYQCDYDSCNRKFAHKGDLQVHIRAKHTKEKRYKCKKCRRRFVSSSNLNVHLRHAHYKSHRPCRRQECLFCSKSFVSSEDLQKHMRIHTKEKPYSCSLCHAEFSQEGGRKEHETTHQRKKEAGRNRKSSLIQVITID